MVVGFSADRVSLLECSRSHHPTQPCSSSAPTPQPSGSSRILTLPSLLIFILRLGPILRQGFISSNQFFLHILPSSACHGQIHFLLPPSMTPFPSSPSIPIPSVFFRLLCSFLTFNYLILNRPLEPRATTPRSFRSPVVDSLKML